MLRVVWAAGSGIFSAANAAMFIKARRRSVCSIQLFHKVIDCSKARLAAGAEIFHGFSAQASSFLTATAPF